jgi:tRNA A-37 threonylcarbamoyl transferase component Bud32
MAEGPKGAMHELDPLIGLTISGRYRVHSLIGQGGMGKVFQAQQIPLGRQVALKVLEAEGVDQEFSRRFFQEAAILAKLQSRHTVTIYDYGRDGDTYFIAMELVVGGSLDRVLAADGPFPPRRALGIATQICRSLREAHGQGIIHRDLKPGNVMLTHSEEGEELAKVLDFGLAKRVDRGGGEDTKTDTVPGSPKYMAPEVIRQQPIDGRADMYGLGVMLYQMITGVVPFDRPNLMDILVAHLQETPRPMRLANPAVNVPEPLERLVARCMAKHPDDRFPDMQTLMEALRALAMELGLHSEPSWAGTSLAPDPAPSGVRPTTERLRLEQRDIAPEARAAANRGGSASSRNAFLFGVIGAVVVAAGVAAWSAPSSEVALAPSEPPPAPAPAAPSQQGDEAVDLAHPDMVFEADEMTPSVDFEVSSEPPGASVWLNGDRIGVTPMKHTHRHADATIGSELTLVLKLPGHDAKTLKQTITGPMLTLSAELDPIVDSEMEALGKRAAAVQRRAAAEPSPVLQVKPADGIAPAAETDAPDEGAADEGAEEATEEGADEAPAEDEPAEDETEPEQPKPGRVERNPYSGQE